MIEEAVWWPLGLNWDEGEDVRNESSIANLFWLFVCLSAQSFSRSLDKITMVTCVLVRVRCLSVIKLNHLSAKLSRSQLCVCVCVCFVSFCVVIDWALLGIMWHDDEIVWPQFTFKAADSSACAKQCKTNICKSRNS